MVFVMCIWFILIFFSIFNASINDLNLLNLNICLVHLRLTSWVNCFSHTKVSLESTLNWKYQIRGLVGLIFCWMCMKAKENNGPLLTSMKGGHSICYASNFMDRAGFGNQVLADGKEDCLNWSTALLCFMWIIRMEKHIRKFWR